IRIEIAQAEGFVTQADQGVTVMLDTALTPELIEEGFVRELVSKIQTMRKEAGFEVMDRIRVYEEGNEKIEQILKENEKQVAGEVLADEVIFGQTAGYTKEWNINSEKVKLGVEKV
ncbi:MAG: isoleucine--tRNA ligase, partial [Eubacterium sp.]|nr:isoleucine--tRNA ligase [Eubacterium sp.]